MDEKNLPVKKAEKGIIMQRYTDYDETIVRLIQPVHDELTYCGRIDHSDPDAPVFVQPGSFVRMSFTGSSWVRAVVMNHRSYNDSWVGVLSDRNQYRVKIEKDEEPVVLTLVENLEKETTHEITFFKRMDQCHTYQFLGFLVEYGARVEKARPLPRKKIEFYGDSVTAGEVSEAQNYAGMPDPPSEGEYNNAYFSYAWATARRLHAAVHLVAQGGIALRDGTGYYENGTRGMESCFDRIYFSGEKSGEPRWNFARYTPHVVVVAIGQNDAWPEDIMKNDYYGEQAQQWREHYKAFLCRLRENYPHAWIVLTTTILNHHPGWDRSIGKVCAEIRDPKTVHFLYQENGRGTPGHVRASEAMQMALELSGFIEGLAPDVWD